MLHLSQMKCNVCGKEFEGRADAKYCSSACRVKASRSTKAQIATTTPPEIPFEDHGDDPGTLIGSELAGKDQSLYVYHETFLRDNGKQYRVRVVSQWSPEQINKLRSQSPTKVRVTGYGEAENAPAPKVVKGWKKA